MQNQKPNTGGDMRSPKDEIASTLKSEASTARETLHDARDKVQRKAGEYVSEAKAAAFQQAEGAQQSIGERIAALSGAMRAAGEHLAKDDQTTMSKLINDAAGGIERFSESLKTKKFDEILDDVRTLGRDNSGALFAGSVLAGLALGRFVKSSVPRQDAQQTPTGKSTAGKSMAPKAGQPAGAQADQFGKPTPANKPFQPAGASPVTGASPVKDPLSSNTSGAFGEVSKEKRP